MKYIKRFSSHQEYLNYKGTTDSIKPLLSRCLSEEENHKDDLNYTMSVTYNVPSSSDYRLVNNSMVGFMYGNIDDIFIDGSLINKTEMYDSSYIYTFSAGEHIVDYVFNKDSSGALAYVFQNIKYIDHAVIPDNFTQLYYTFNQSDIKTVELGCNLEQIKYAFYDSSLTSIVVPNNVSILVGAFENCRNLETVVLGSSLNTIDYYCFQNCSSLQNLTFKGNYLKRLTSYFNFQNVSINSLTFPSSLEYVNYQSVGYCKINDLSIYFQNSLQASGFFYNCSINNLYIDSSYVIPYSTIVSSTIKNITFGPHVKRLANHCLSLLTPLDTLIFPKNINIYDNEIFSYSGSIYINNLIFQDDIIDISIHPQVLGFSSNSIHIENISIGNIKFQNTSTRNQATGGYPLPVSNLQFLSEIINSSTKNLYFNCPEIGGMFNDKYYQNTSINISLGPNVKIIGNHSFCDYYGYGTLTIPSTVKAINHYSFYDVRNLKINFENYDTLEYIGNYTFGRSNVSTFTLGTNLKYYGIKIFYNVNNVNLIFKSKHLTFNPNGYEHLITGENTLEPNTYQYPNYINNSDKALTGLRSIASLEITNTVEYIPPYLFYQSLNNESILTIPESVVTIDDYAFYDNNVSVLNLPENGSLKTIGKYALAYLWGSNLKSITIPASVEKIDTGAFYDCYNVSTFTFAENSKLKYIGDSAFKSINKLKEIIIPNSVEILGTSTCTQGNGVFYGCNLTSIQLGSGLKEIGSYCFENQYKIESLIIPDSVEIINQYAIYNDLLYSTSKFYELTVGAKHICSNAFINCINTSVLTLTDSVNHIEQQAFINIGSSTNLFNEIHIPKNVRCIENNAFVFNHDYVTKLTVDPRNKWYKSIDDNKIVEVSTNNIILAI